MLEKIKKICINTEKLWYFFIGIYIFTLFISSTTILYIYPFLERIIKYIKYICYLVFSLKIFLDWKRRKQYYHSNDSFSIISTFDFLFF